MYTYLMIYLFTNSNFIQKVIMNQNNVPVNKKNQHILALQTQHGLGCWGVQVFPARAFKNFPTYYIYIYMQAYSGI